MPAAITVKLKASDISADGKTASVQLDEVPSSVYPPDNFYAAFPASAVADDVTFCDNEFTFSAYDEFPMCSWLSGDTFEFHALCSAVTFSANGDYDACVFSGTSWQTVSYDSFSAAVTSESQTYRKGLSGAYYYLPRSLSNGSAALAFPGDFSLPEGFRIYLGKDGEFTKLYESSDALSLKRADVLDLGDITPLLVDYDGPAPKAPQMPVMGKYTKYSITKVPELSGLCLNADKTALWGVGDDGCLGVIEFDGTVSKTWTPSKSCGMEDISINPATGELFIADEDFHRVVRIDPGEIDYDAAKVPFTELFKVQEAIDGKYGNSSVEGVSYYKDDILFVGTQVGANLWKYTTSGEKLWKVSLRTLTSNVITEVGGLCYDHKNDWLWVIDSETQKIYVLDEEITHILASYPIRFAGNCESVCVDHEHGCVWVGDDDDTSKLFRIEFEGL